jgi:DNA-binding transcriptional LysR family regulator
MDLAWLEDFEALAACGNFSRAAEMRHVTQPAFSRRIRALEYWACAPLFERGRQPVAPTEAGIRLRPHFADVLRRLREAREEARAISGAEATLRFAATHALSFSFFPGWLAALGQHGPRGAIHLVSDGLEACEAAMLAGRADFLLGHHHPAVPSRLAEPSFVARLVARDRLCLVAAPGIGDEAASLGYGEGSGLGRIVATIRPDAAWRRPIFTSHLAAVLRGLAHDGRGAAWLPESLVGPDLADGSLVRLGAEDIALEIRLVRPTATLGRAAEQFWAGLP